ncbi:hypothetical protein C2G38_2219365 [Gigaspora rosea]|uniref:Protein kinase domain-containing protein n=1 Tax=Gigaspora rosea TaxID=44941 RepID=A0A397U781_9GLOM|nr:hypothetical protein C2G38_2219365 [Gigaspora rosea]
MDNNGSDKYRIAKELTLRLAFLHTVDIVHCDLHPRNFLWRPKHTEGINCFGYCYKYGIEVEKNENKAFTYYQKSADMYSPNGMYQVG